MRGTSRNSRAVVAPRAILRARPVLLVAFVVVLLAGGSAAFAYWTGTGSGTGQGSSGSTVPLTISPGTSSAGLYPGASGAAGSVDVSVNVTNPNTSPLTVTALSLDTSQGTGGFAVDSSHSACPLPASLALETRSNAGAGWVIPAKSGLVNGTRTIVLQSPLSMVPTAPNTCQGATFTVFFKASS